MMQNSSLCSEENPQLHLVIVIPPQSGVSYAINDNVVPEWIKSTAEAWVNGQITDIEYINGIEYLIENEIINIPKIDELEKENKILETKNKQLQSKNKSLEGKLNTKQETKTGLEPTIGAPTTSMVLDVLYHYEFVNPMHEMNLIWYEFVTKLNSGCESFPIGDRYGFLLFSDVLTNAEKSFGPSMIIELHNIHPFYHNLYDIYKIHGFPEKPAGFETRFNQMMLTYSMMGLCFEYIHEKFGEFPLMEIAGIGVHCRLKVLEGQVFKTGVVWHI